MAKPFAESSPAIICRISCESSTTSTHRAMHDPSGDSDRVQSKTDANISRFLEPGVERFSQLGTCINLDPAGHHAATTAADFAGIDLVKATAPSITCRAPKIAGRELFL